MTTTTLPASADTVPVRTPVFLYMAPPAVRDASDPLAGAVAGAFPAQAVGYRLYRAAMVSSVGSPMGFVAAQPGYATAGRLFVLRAEPYQRALDGLDQAFGFRQGDPASVYTRLRASVDWVVEDSAVALHAWLYVGGSMLASVRHLSTPVPHGDWAAWLAEDHAYRSSDPSPHRPVR